MLALSAVEWQRWRDEVLRSASTTTAGELLARRLDALEAHMRVTAGDEAGDTLRSRHERDAVHTVQRVETKDAATQLFTLQNVCLSRYVLRRLCAELSLRALARRLGRVAAQLHTLSVDYLRSLSLMYADGAADTTRRSSNDSSSPLPQHEGSIAALCALLGDECRDSVNAGEARVRLSEWLQKGRSSSHATLAATAAARTDAAVQTDMSMSAASAAAPFLCRRCRRDGRAEYAYDRQGRQLQRLVHS